MLGIFFCSEQLHGVIELVEVETPQAVDLLDGLDGNVTLQQPGQLLDASLRTKVSGQNVLKIERDVFAEKLFLVFDAQTLKQFLAERKLGDEHQHFAQVSNEQSFV